jgi:hypothetical protein
MRDRAVETFRSILTITGLVLLIVFGARAAGQAQNKQLAGATHRATLGLPTFGLASPAYAHYGGEVVSTVSKVVAARTTVPTHTAAPTEVKPAPAQSQATVTSQTAAPTTTSEDKATASRHSSQEATTPATSGKQEQTHRSDPSSVTSETKTQNSKSNSGDHSSNRGDSKDNVSQQDQTHRGKSND